MGEIAEMMLDGTMCQQCGEWLNDGDDGDDGEGFPVSCESCKESDYAKAVKQKLRTMRPPGTNPHYVKCRQASDAGMKAFEASLAASFPAMRMSASSKKKMARKLTMSALDNLTNSGVK